MVYIKEQSFVGDPQDNEYQASVREGILRDKPFAASSIVFKAKEPVKENPLDRHAPLLLLVLLVGFLFLK